MVIQPTLICELVSIRPCACFGFFCVSESVCVDKVSGLGVSVRHGTVTGMTSHTHSICTVSSSITYTSSCASITPPPPWLLLYVVVVVHSTLLYYMYFARCMRCESAIFGADHVDSRLQVG